MDEYHAIRKYFPTTPFILLSGHRHVLYYEQYDNSSFTLESGKYFEHLGLVTFELEPQEPGSILDFNHQWLNTNIQHFYDLSGTNASTFPTQKGAQVKAQIASYVKLLDLNHVYGCSPMTFSPYSAPTAKDSLYNLWINTIMPTFYSKDSPRLPFYITNTASLRSSLYAGPVTKNDLYTVSPFNDTYYYFKGLGGSQLTALIGAIDNSSKEEAFRPGGCLPADIASTEELPAYLYTPGPISASASYDVVAAQYDCWNFQRKLQALYPSQTWTPALYPGHPTSMGSTELLQEFLVSKWPCS
jgi:2',3'-cyclic-nucleotide 2'-phosphodiesterase (5'-nucleotidase family)